MTTPPKKTVAVGVAGVIIAVLPALFTYLENRQEIKAKYAKTQEQASVGYETLVTSVKELQSATLAQHDYIVKMQAQLELMEKMVLATNRRVNLGSGAARGETPVQPPVADVRLPAPPERPAYASVPNDFTAAQMQR
jgi:hypothetical protein